MKAKAYEIEVEINEIRYTEGNDAERITLEEVQKDAMDSLLEKFPEIKQDQTPKYTKMFDRVFDRLPFGRTLLRWGLL